MFDPDVVFTFVTDVRCRKACLDIAARLRWAQCKGVLAQGKRMIEFVKQIGSVGFLFVFNLNQRCREARDLPFFRQNQRNGLPTE